MKQVMEHSREGIGKVGAHRVGSGLAHVVITYLSALLLALPLFIIIHPFVPELSIPIGEGVRVDHGLTFILVLVAFIVLVNRFQTLVYGLLIAGMLAITVTTIGGWYTVGDMYKGYAEFLRSLRDTAEQVPMASRRAKPFHDAEKLRALVDPRNAEVRKAAVRMATANFTNVKSTGDEFILIQSFSIFKEVNNKWRYVADVKGGEYFASPAESLELMAGDCDDHAVLMATLITAIGGEVRLVRTEGHVYPELKVGDDTRLERSAHLIRKVLFTKEVGDAPLYHHTDPNGEHWINLDYTRNYPGGELMNERIIGILEVR